MTALYRDVPAPGRESALLPDAALLSATFEGLEPGRVQEQARASALLSAWAARAAAVAPDGSGGPASGVVLVGTVGVGKTHLLTAAARRLCALLPEDLRGPYRVLLVGEQQLRAYVRACWARGEGFPERLRRAMEGRNRSWLFVDDLGSCAADQRWCEEMGDVLLLRHGSRFSALTAATTNLTVPELEQVYGSRSGSRLKQMALAVTLSGSDQRRARRGA